MGGICTSAQSILSIATHGCKRLRCQAGQTNGDACPCWAAQASISGSEHRVHRPLLLPQHCPLTIPHLSGIPRSRATLIPSHSMTKVWTEVQIVPQA